MSSSKASPLKKTFSFICLFSLVLLLVVSAMRWPDTRYSIAISQAYQEKLVTISHENHEPTNSSLLPVGLPEFLSKEFSVDGSEFSIGLVNVDDEQQIRRWEEAGRTERVRFDRLSDEVKWERLFPEWIDEDERKEQPQCPDIPMPRFEDFPEFDVVVVQTPCGGDGPSGRGVRDPFRLQVHLVAANVAVKNGRTSKGTSVVVAFLGSCKPMLEMFRCEDVVWKGEVDDEVAVAYRPDLRRLKQKLHLPVGSCQLSVPLVKHGDSNAQHPGGADYDFSSIDNPLDHPREAYVTVLHSSEAYVCGAIALAQSIRHTNSTKDLVLLADKSISKASRKALKLAGWNIRTIQRIRSPFAKKDAYNEWNYSKLRLWQLSDYDKLIFIDSDFIVLKNLDHFFSLPQLSAVANDGVLFNSGLMLVEPSECVFEMLMENKERLFSYNGGDQGFLNEVFTWWHRWPGRLNWLKIFKRTATAAREVPPHVYTIHYLGMKPWTCYRDYDCNWDVEGQQMFASDVANRRWWALYDAMPERLRPFCGLKKGRVGSLKKWRARARRLRLSGSRWETEVHDPRQYQVYRS